jgi:Fur family ferric uptake transcriptional regulator
VQELLRNIEERILADGGKRSRSRQAVIEIFLRSGSHLTADELTAEVRKERPEIGAATVYRTLKLLARLGLANEVDLAGGATRYESGLHSHHDHLVCLRCGAVTEFEDTRIERLQQNVAERHGFTPTSHRLSIFGVCTACSGREDGR